MPYTHMNAYLSYNNNMTLKDEYVEEFNQLLQEQFENASDVWTIQEEYPFASEEYRDIPVRVTHVINSATGEKRGDDYKHLLFKDLDHDTKPGWYYKFDNNTWISYNTDKIKSLAADTYIERCNNTLRWLSDDGGLYEVPCFITELIKQTRDSIPPGANSISVPAGFTEITVQLNDKTNKIRPNQRFLFGRPGNWACFRVHGAGVQNWDNLETYNNNGFGILLLHVSINSVNDQTDDIVNGICDVKKSVYTIHINNQNVIGNIGKKIQLTSSVQLNNQTVTRPVTWLSDDENIAKVDSETGLLTMIGLGGCEISCSLKDNPDRVDSIIINVSQSPVYDYEIFVTPDNNGIYQGKSQTYNVYLWLNGVQQSDAFVFTLNPNTIPSSNYDYAVLGSNSFSINNKKMFLTDVLNIDCVSGSHSKSISVQLKASF